MIVDGDGHVEATAIRNKRIHGNNISDVNIKQSASFEDKEYLLGLITLTVEYIIPEQIIYLQAWYQLLQKCPGLVSEEEYSFDDFTMGGVDDFLLHVMRKAVVYCFPITIFDLTFGLIFKEALDLVLRLLRNLIFQRKFIQSIEL